MPTVALPSITPIAASAQAAPVQIQLGQIISGLVVALVDETTLRLQTTAGTIDVETDTTLPPGTPVTVSLQGTPQQPALVVTAVGGGTGQIATLPTAAAASEAETQAGADTPAPVIANSSAGNGAGSSATVAVEQGAAAIGTRTTSPLMQAALASASAIVRNAATSQGGLAALYADLEAALAAPTPNTPSPAAQASPLQNPYSQVSAATTPALPTPVVDAARQLLAMRLNLASAPGIDADAVKSALLQSGLAAGISDPTATSQSAAPINIGAALIILRQALKNWQEQEPVDQTTPELPQNPGQITADARSAAPVALYRGALAATPLPATTLANLIERRSEMPTAPESAQNPVTTPTAGRAAVPMPPYRGAPTVAQAPAAPSFSENATPHELAAHLLGQTDAAIARQTLLRLASMPDRDSVDPIHNQTASSRVMFDIPVATAQGTGVAQMAIERDGRHQSQSGNAPVWRANFSIDLEPIGPLHVHIALSGDRATVTLNAERANSAAALSADLPLLEAGLRHVALEPGELRCQAGSPRPAAASPGTFLDQAT